MLGDRSIFKLSTMSCFLLGYSPETRKGFVETTKTHEKRVTIAFGLSDLLSLSFYLN